MHKIHLIMPMGGGGTRFGNSDFDCPKPLIEIQKKPFFYWAVQSIVKYIEVEDITFIVLKEHVDCFNIDKKILFYYPSAKIIVIPKVLDGAVLTCLDGIKEITDDCPLLFNDCDHAFISKAFYSYVNKADFNNVDGALLTFKSDCSQYSYVVFDENGSITGTIEKVVASNQAICGAYYFGNKEIFESAAKSYLKDCLYSEFFMSGVYCKLAKQRNNIRLFPIDEHLSFGTPAEYEAIKDDRRFEKYDTLEDTR